MPTRRATRSGPSAWLLRLLAAAFLVLLLPSTALAAEPRPGETVVVGPNEVINDDLYAVGGTITVEGTVNGDLGAFGGTITVTGLAVGGTVVINGPVREDVLVGGGTMTVGPAAQVGRDLYLGAVPAPISAAAAQ